MAATPPRVPRRPVDGVLLLDKPAGISSNAALQRARRAFRAEKAGHTGTLDPAASGLLPLCLGEATKFASHLLDAVKGYRATIRFGTTTTTGDGEGNVVSTHPVDVDVDALSGALARFRGVVRQVPPMHAALKFEGRAYYDYARAGIEIPRAAREVTIHALDLVSWDPPDAVVDVVCSKGTYVRVLAQDLGEALGCGAHLASLRRTATGGFALADAVALDGLEAMDEADRERLLLPVDVLIASLPRLDVPPEHASALRHGQPIECPRDAAPRARAYDAAGALIGVLERDGDRYRPHRLLRQDR